MKEPRPKLTTLGRGLLPPWSTYSLYSLVLTIRTIIYDPIRQPQKGTTLETVGFSWSLRF